MRTEEVADFSLQKLNSAKTRLNEITIQHESGTTENKFLRDKVEELALQTAELEEKGRGAQEARSKIESQMEEVVRALRKEEQERELDQKEWRRQRQEEEKKYQKAIDTNSRVSTVSRALPPHRLTDSQQDLERARSEATQFRNLVSVREEDVKKLQATLDGLQSESRRLGESHSNDRFALEIELDRLKRDVERYEGDLKRERADAEQRDALLREHGLDLAALVSHFVWRFRPTS